MRKPLEVLKPLRVALHRALSAALPLPPRAGKAPCPCEHSCSELHRRHTTFETDSTFFGCLLHGFLLSFICLTVRRYIYEVPSTIVWIYHVCERPSARLIAAGVTGHKRSPAGTIDPINC